MTVLAGIAALALIVGFYAGRRMGAPAPTWKQRTSRIALGRLVVSLLVVLTARRVQHITRVRSLPGVSWGPRLHVLRGGVARLRW